MSVKALPQSEKQFQAAVEELVRLNGWLVFHPFDSRRSTPGFPDLTLVRGRRLVFAELKTDRGRASRDQMVWQEALLRVAYRAPNVEVFLWRPSDWSEIERVLAR